MRREPFAVVLLAMLVFLPATKAVGGLVDFAVGAYGGANLPLEEGSSAGTVLGAKVRVLTPIPIIGVEAWYSRFAYENPDNVADSGDLSLALDGDGFDLYGADVLIGSVRGIAGFSWYGSVGVSAPKYEKIINNVKDNTRKLGGQVGLGLEIVPPAIGLGIEARASVMFMDLSGDVDDKMGIVTVGLNYYF